MKIQKTYRPEQKKAIFEEVDLYGFLSVVEISIKTHFSKVQIKYLLTGLKHRTVVPTLLGEEDVISFAEAIDIMAASLVDYPALAVYRAIHDWPLCRGDDAESFRRYYPKQYDLIRDVEAESYKLYEKKRTIQKIIRFADYDNVLKKAVDEALQRYGDQGKTVPIWALEVLELVPETGNEMHGEARSLRHDYQMAIFSQTRCELDENGEPDKLKTALRVLDDFMREQERE